MVYYAIVCNNKVVYRLTLHSPSLPTTLLYPILSYPILSLPHSLTPTQAFLFLLVLCPTCTCCVVTPRLSLAGGESLLLLLLALLRCRPPSLVVPVLSLPVPE